VTRKRPKKPLHTVCIHKPRRIAQRKGDDDFERTHRGGKEQQRGKTESICVQNAERRRMVGKKTKRSGQKKNRRAEKRPFLTICKNCLRQVQLWKNEPSVS